MADSLPSFWRLDDFDPLYEAWLKIENPSDELQNIVLQWLAGLAEDPYRRLKRDPEMSFLYSGPIPGTREPDGRFVCLTYSIDAENRLVKCQTLVNLSPPFL